jgi:integrase
VRVGELLDDLLVEYQANDRRSIERAKYSVAHLRGVFGDARAQTLDRALVSDYVVRRKAARKADDGTEIPGATNGTINRELAALKRSLTLAVQRRKILTRPYIPLLAENNARQGLFEPEQLTAVLRQLPEAIRPVATFAYLTGWRLSEIINLTWRQVDFGAATVRLEPGTTKNRAGRMFPFTPELRALLEAQRAATAAIRAKTERIIPNVFHHDGQPIKSFRRAWLSACVAAGVPGRIFHDFRRTAVRNLERAGVSRSLAMQMVGHKTEAIYRRYAIVSDADLRDAADKLAAIAGPGTGTTTGTVTRIGGR